MKNSFDTLSTLQVGDKQYQFHDLEKLKAQGYDITHLPYSLKILLENLLRKEDGVTVTKDDILALAKWNPKRPQDSLSREIVFTPARTVLQDFTGVPAVVDLAAMRDAIHELGGDSKLINPLQPVELVIDHSIQVDYFATPDAMEKNGELDYHRNAERYAFLRWGQKAFSNFKVVPPNSGIVHQVNLEHLSRVVFSTDEEPNTTGIPFAYPDTCIGTDSHTPMVNGLGVLAWGVGGIEAEATMLGQPISMLIPQVIGFRLSGALSEGTTATDLVLTITEMLRKKGVVGKFVEFYGPGIASLTIADRATIGNMSPEYGATVAIFPPDELTVQYLRQTHRSEPRINLVETYMKAQGLFHTKDAVEPAYSDTLTLDLSTVEPSIAGPGRPQDRIPLSKTKSAFEKVLPSLRPLEQKKTATAQGHLQDGAVVIAAITSCTNTSNPSVMLAAGLLAKKAIDRGLTQKPWVKTSLAPGSKVVTSYLEKAGLTPYLDQLGFGLTGYGCTTCIGNSGPLPEAISQEIQSRGLVVASVLSGNRNFEGRIHPEVRANFLMSPPLVVAFAIAGKMQWDPIKEPLGEDKNGKPIFLRDIWPTQKEIEETAHAAVRSEMYADTYQSIFHGDHRWTGLEVPEGDRYIWNESSTYIQQPSFFKDMKREANPFVDDIRGARALAVLGDSVTTDHISPAGSIKKDSPAGKFLRSKNVEPADFNSYGSRRGNHEVMVRGTFANVRIRNKLVPQVEGGFTSYLPTGDLMSIYDAAMRYQEAKIPLCIIAGKDYGSGSSRDWAAKGPYLQGIKFVIAESFERIHRSNLVGMGILPLQFSEGESLQKLGLTGKEYFDVFGLKEALDFQTGTKIVNVRATGQDGTVKEFKADVRIDTPQEILYYLNGGILHYVLRQLISGNKQPEILSSGVSVAAQVHHKAKVTDKQVEEGSKESFPASDPPAY